MTKNTAFKLSHDADREGFYSTVHRCAGDWLVDIRRVGSGYDARELRTAMRRVVKESGGSLQE